MFHWLNDSRNTCDQSHKEPLGTGRALTLHVTAPPSDPARWLSLERSPRHGGNASSKKSLNGGTRAPTAGAGLPPSTVWGLFLFDHSVPLEFPHVFLIHLSCCLFSIFRTSAVERLFIVQSLCLCECCLWIRRVIGSSKSILRSSNGPSLLISSTARSRSTFFPKLSSKILYQHDERSPASSDMCYH
jgi:hypothetical protein